MNKGKSILANTIVVLNLIVIVCTALVFFLVNFSTQELNGDKHTLYLNQASVYDEGEYNTSLMVINKFERYKFGDEILFEVEDFFGNQILQKSKVNDFSNGEIKVNDFFSESQITLTTDETYGCITFENDFLGELVLYCQEYIDEFYMIVKAIIGLVILLSAILIINMEINRRKQIRLNVERKKREEQEAIEKSFENTFPNLKITNFVKEDNKIIEVDSEKVSIPISFSSDVEHMISDTIEFDETQMSTHSKTMEFDAIQDIENIGVTITHNTVTSMPYLINDAEKFSTQSFEISAEHREQQIEPTPTKEELKEVTKQKVEQLKENNKSDNSEETVNTQNDDVEDEQVSLLSEDEIMAYFNSLMSDNNINDDNNTSDTVEFSQEELDEFESEIVQLI